MRCLLILKGSALLFKRDMVDAIVEGRKCQTRRFLSKNPRSPWWEGGCRYQPGKEFGVQGGRGMGAVTQARVTGLRKEPLGHISEIGALWEGFVAGQNPHGWFETARDAFMAYFRMIHRSEPPLEKEVWVVTFEALNAEAVFQYAIDDYFGIEALAGVGE